MCTMCNVCGSELTSFGSGCCYRICGRPFCQECRKQVSLVSDGECPIWFCKSCLENYDQESSRQDNLSPFVTPLISPTLSVTSFESCASSFGEFSADMDSQSREDFDEGALGTGSENLDSGIFRHSENQLNGPLLISKEIQSTDFKDRLKDLSITLPTEEIDRIDLVTVDNFDENEIEKLTFINDSSKEVEIVKAGDGSRGTENTVDATCPLSPSYKEELENPDELLWMPPEAEDVEDDMECSVANNDDDDEYSDGTKWGQSTSLGCIDEKQGSKEEREKAMGEVMNGHFRSLVSRLLASEDIAFSKENVANWLNIVSYLSWEAASLVKPDHVEGKEMHPGCYVKVKCIASGARSESHLVKGLVFSKNAAHKHMPTRYKNPRLLLLEGILGHRSGSLSSFDQIEQENDYLKPIIEMVESSHPNVVLVEKTVSRDVQESLLAKGITLVFDMRLPRLERIGWCTGSQIISSADNLMNPKLKHCDSFRVEKFVTEYSSYEKGGKKLSKTLMFFEGFPKSLGCTILLKGASNDELKKVKCVVQHAVFAAYHLILETSFLVDQRAVFSKIRTIGVRNDMLTDKTTILNSTGIASSPTTLDIAISNGSLDLVDEEISTLYNFGPLDFNSSVNDIEQPEKFNDSEVEKEPDTHTAVLPIPRSLKTVNFEMVENTESMPAFCDPSIDNCKTEANNGVEVLHMDDIKTVLGPQSILVSMSSRCILNKSVCKLSHLSRIKYYGNSDMSVGRFLHENLLNQEQHCSECGEPPEAHVYCYANQNGKLTIIVKQLPPDRFLSGKAEGKIWMWNQCLKCKPENGIPKQSRRVVMSSAARALSFGKFLELGVSNHSTSSCGHSLQRDLLHFYGFGSTVAAFRCSSIDLYAACIPPPFLEFNNPNGQEWLKKEANEVLEKGNILFREVTNSLQKIWSGFSDSLPKRSINRTSSIKEISEIEEMLRQEKSDFEASLQKAFCKKRQSSQSVNEILWLNRLNQELLIELYVWDRRLHSLLLSSSELHQTGNLVESNGNVVKVQDSQQLPEAIVQNFVDLDVAELPNSGGPSSDEWIISTSIDFDQNSSPISYDPSAPIALDGPNSQEDYLPISDHSQLDKSSFKDRQLSLSMSQKSLSSTSDDPECWIWNPFSETREEYRRDLNRGYSQKFESINSYIPAHLSSVIPLITQEGSRLYFPVGSSDDVVSVYEDELTSIIACALAVLQEKETAKDREGSLGKEIESQYSPTSTYWSSSDSLDLEGIRLRQSASSDELSTSGSEGFSPFDPSISSDVLHPEIPMGVGRFNGKAKYSVVSIHAKQFYALRKRCCPSELSYISSLSRCVKWDAQGGKSRVFFAKTLDGRFIIKQVKRTELDSFLKFASDYFKHMSYSLSSGSQTCLAKILGIYQVTVRQSKNGKELKIVLMVMENLLFARNVSRLYDLKGALHSRYTSDENGTGEVLLDQNFVEDMLTRPLYISRKAKHLLQRAIWNDTYFLTSINVMDYSLLVGVDKQRRELVVGIIDYLRQYTWDKHLETWVKASLVVPKNELPTVISPKEYRKRFRKFMSTYFLTVPDHLCSDGSRGPCKFCSDSSDYSSQLKMPR